MAQKKKRTKRNSESRMRPGHGLGAIRTVQLFRSVIDAQSGLSKAQRLRLVEQAEILLRDLYAHLPLKRAMHAIDPLQRLRLLKQRVSELSITGFQAALLEIFKSLRDLHTNYSLPACPSRLFIRARKSCCLANIFMMQAANMFEFYDSAFIWRLFPASFRRVFAQGEVRSGLIVVTDVARDNASKVPLAQHDHVV